MGIQISQEPVILMWKTHKSSTWYETWIAKTIEFFTGKPYYHVAIYLKGFTYESTVMNGQQGALKTEGIISSDHIERYSLRVPMNMTQTTMLGEILNRKVTEAKPYNFYKLLALTFVYPTRWFWNKIGWVPFQDEFFGEVCSVFADSSFKEVGVDLLPDHNEEYTAPGDIPLSKLLEKI